MVEEIEIKRKVFEVIDTIGEHSKKVSRKGEIYFLKDFGNNKEKFKDYIDGATKCKNNGIVAPKIYMYDKDRCIVIEDYIEHKNVMEMLMEGELPEELYEKVFIMNWRAKHGKFSIHFDPVKFGWDGKELYYLSQLARNYSEKWNLEKDSIFLWFYTKDFVNYLMEKGLDIDQKRANTSQGYVNKQLSLTVVKYYR